MKFCKNLQRIVDISNPEWAPYWTNYKMLKKLIKELPSLVPSDDTTKTGEKAKGETKGDGEGTKPNTTADKEVICPASPSSAASSVSSTCPSSAAKAQISNSNVSLVSSATVLVTAKSEARTAPEMSSSSNVSLAASREHSCPEQQRRVQAIEKSPGEVAFFKLLHAELKKASYFFERAIQEYSIREERVQEGMQIMKKPNSIMVSEKWSLLAKSLYRFYKDLLLLETFAIMTYCSFSKILKKHDKVTGYNTRSAFMANVVNKANFAHYPRLLEMVSHCEALYEEVSEHLMTEGKEGLCEDERLFINMIHRLNAQVMNTAEAEGAPEMQERMDSKIKRASMSVPTSITANGSRVDPSIESFATSSLRSLVEDIGGLAQVSAGACSDENDDTNDGHSRGNVNVSSSASVSGFAPLGVEAESIGDATLRPKGGTSPSHAPTTDGRPSADPPSSFSAPQGPRKRSTEDDGGLLKRQKGA